MMVDMEVQEDKFNILVDKIKFFIFKKYIKDENINLDNINISVISYTTTDNESIMFAQRNDRLYKAKHINHYDEKSNKINVYKVEEYFTEDIMYY